MKDELSGKIMTTFVELRLKTCNYLIHDSTEDKKAKWTKSCVIERKLKFENYKNCLKGTQPENKINNLEKKIDIDSYDYYLIIKELAEQFKKQVTCSGENIKKYIIFTVPIEKKFQELIKIKKKLQKKKNK